MTVSVLDTFGTFMSGISLTDRIHIQALSPLKFTFVTGGHKPDAGS